MSDFRPEARQNSHDNVFNQVAGENLPRLMRTYLAHNDFSAHTKRAIVSDLQHFAQWFQVSNGEPFALERVTTTDVVDFKNWMHREKQLAVASVNRAIVLIRRFFDWAVTRDLVAINPAKQVKELRRQQPSPVGLDRTLVRKLLREVELRRDVRGAAIFYFLLCTGCRVGDLVNIYLNDLTINERAGSVVFRYGKGGKQRTVPLTLPARKALQQYLIARPPGPHLRVFLGERGAITEAGVRGLCTKYSIALGVKLHPHLFRHTFAKQFLFDTGNDLVALAQILGHENLNTTSRYSQLNNEQLAAQSERVSW